MCRVQREAGVVGLSRTLTPETAYRVLKLHKVQNLRRNPPRKRCLTPSSSEKKIFIHLKKTQIAKMFATIANKCGQVEHPSVALFYIYFYFVTSKINTNLMMILKACFRQCTIIEGTRFASSSRTKEDNTESCGASATIWRALVSYCSFFPVFFKWGKNPKWFQAATFLRQDEWVWSSELREDTFYTTAAVATMLSPAKNLKRDNQVSQGAHTPPRSLVESHYALKVEEHVLRFLWISLRIWSQTSAFADVKPGRWDPTHLK